MRPQTLRSLQFRNYRLWFVGQVISVCGTWTQTVAQAVLVLRLSGDNGVAAGGSVALQFTPTLLFGMWGGLLADRFDKRRMLMISQAALAVFALALAIADLSGVVTLWLVFVLVGLSGCASAVDQPARQSFVPELVPREHVPNAIGLNSTVFNLARMVGPAIAAGIIFVSGTGGCFLVNAFSYVAILVALVRMRPEELHRGRPLPRARGQVREGVRYVLGQPVLRANLLLMTMVGTLAFNFNVVLPLMAKVTFGGGAGTVSLVFMCQGLGALFGALGLASLGRADGFRLVLATIVLGVALSVAALAPGLVLFLVVMPVVGLGQILTASTSNALIQLDADPAFRGRVTSLRTLTVIGSTPIGGLLTGAVAERFSPRWAMAIGGLGCLLGLAFARSLVASRRSPIPPSDPSEAVTPGSAIPDADPARPLDPRPSVQA